MSTKETFGEKHGPLDEILGVAREVMTSGGKFVGSATTTPASVIFDACAASIGAPKKPTAPINAAPRETKNDVAAPIDGERLIDLPAVLRRVPVARSTLFERIREGKFPKGRKFGRRRLWRECDVDSFVREV